ncbi:MAG TPA: hypothetical protein DHU96_07780 [Actinobacteria bacterium]|nr:hypothetical protein [Actinomycetota bacterium]
MTPIEDRLRAATRAAAGTVAPGSAPPLRLPEDSGGTLQSLAASRTDARGWRATHGRWRSRRMPAWAAPLAAAAAVAVILWTMDVVGSGHRELLIGHPHSGSHLLHPATVAGLPPFFISDVGTSIVSSASGQIVAEPRLPGLPGREAAGSDGRTFYEALVPPLCHKAVHSPSSGSPASRAAGQRSGAARGTGSQTAAIPCVWSYPKGVASFYRITLTRTGTDVSKLPIPPVSERLNVISPSPDGSRLAIATWTQTGTAGYVRTLEVASTVTGQRRTWTTTAAGSLDRISWLADGHTVALDWQAYRGPGPASGLWLLDTAAPGSNLLAGRPVLARHNPAGTFGTLVISPDGSTVTGIEQHGTGTVHGQRLPQGSVVAFSARTGLPTGVLFTSAHLGGGTYAGIQPLWISHTGQRMLLSSIFWVPRKPGPHHKRVHAYMRVLLVSAGHAPRPLPKLFTDWRVLFNLGDMAER